MSETIQIPEGASGPWRVERFTIPAFSIEAMRCAMDGRPVKPGEYTALRRGNTTVMSDTPAEIQDLAPFKWRLSMAVCETVLINGLGLGIALKMALDQPHIKSIDVVELDHHVLRLVQPFLQDPRLKYHLGDALTQDWPKGKRWNVVWHDIWDNVPNSDDRPAISKLKRKYGRRCDWQGVWCEHQSRY